MSVAAHLEQPLHTDRWPFQHARHGVVPSFALVMSAAAPVLEQPCTPTAGLQQALNMESGRCCPP